MADITSESAAGFISESLADLPRNQQVNVRLEVDKPLRVASVRTHGDVSPVALLALEVVYRSVAAA